MWQGSLPRIPEAMRRQLPKCVPALAGILLLLAGAKANAQSATAKVGPYFVELASSGEFGRSDHRTAVEVTRQGRVVFHRTTTEALAGFRMDARDVMLDGDCLVFFYALAGDGLDDDTLFGVRICGDTAEVAENTVFKQTGEAELRLGDIPRGWDVAKTKAGFRAAFKRLYGRASDGGNYTPKPGSPERVAICDALRVYVEKQHAIAPLKKKIVFKIDRITVNGNYAFFDGVPIYADGSAALYDSLPDMAYVFLLGKVSGRWAVLADFCGTDVPHEAWWMEIRQRLPADLPKSILPDFYRGHLQL
jgi:hypothetical protein